MRVYHTLLLRRRGPGLLKDNKPREGRHTAVRWGLALLKDSTDTKEKQYDEPLKSHPATQVIIVGSRLSQTAAISSPARDAIQQFTFADVSPRANLLCCSYDN